MGDLSIFSRVTLNDLLQFKKANSEKKKIPVQSVFDFKGAYNYSRFWHFRKFKISMFLIEMLINSSIKRKSLYFFHFWTQKA